MKRLLLIVPAFPADEASSYTVPFIQQFAKAFTDSLGVYIDIITLYEPKGKSYEWKGIKVIPLNGPMKGNLIKKAAFILRSSKYLQNLHKINNYDGMLSFWYRETAMIGRLVAKRTNLMHYTWLQGQDVKRSNKYMQLGRPKPDRLIALSEYQNEVLYKYFGIRAEWVAPVALNPKFLPPPNQGDRPYDIMGAGSFIALKNHRFFLQIISEIKKNRRPLKVLLIGNGPLENEYRQYIQDNDLEEIVTLTGLLNHAETMKYMNLSKIFIHTSTFEGGGMVCPESLYLGCHVISTLPLIKDAGKQFFYSTNKMEIVSHIHKILSDPSKPVISHIENAMEDSCRIVYDLFF